MDQTFVRNFYQTCGLLRRSRAGQVYRAAEIIDVDICRGISVLGVHLIVSDVGGHMFKGLAFAPRVHANCYRCARPKTRCEKPVRGHFLICATIGLRLIRKHVMFFT